MTLDTTSRTTRCAFLLRSFIGNDDYIRVYLKKNEFISEHLSRYHTAKATPKPRLTG